MRPLDSIWFKHPRVWIVIGVLMWVVTLTLMIFDREPPTRIADETDTDVSVAAGTMARFVIPVERRLGRGCSVDVSRYLIDAKHGSTTLVPLQHVSAEGLRAREKEAPGLLLLNVRIPVDTLAGRATIRTESLYRCFWNPLTALWPIEDSWAVSFNVLPAREGVVIINP